MNIYYNSHKRPLTELQKLSINNIFYLETLFDIKKKSIYVEA